MTEEREARKASSTPVVKPEMSVPRVSGSLSLWERVRVRVSRRRRVAPSPRPSPGGRGRRVLLCGVVVVVTGTIVLAWPAATWLQGRELWARGGEPLDAVYLVAGARDQDRRISGLVQFCKAREVAGKPLPVILLANDLEVRYEIRGAYDGRHLVELARIKIPPLLGGVLESDAIPDMHTVPGIFYGTDGEMTALAQYLSARPAIDRIAVTTSPYHVRRVVVRLRKHSGGTVDVRVIRLRPGWGDRHPLLVLSELLKMGRDALGLSDAPVISRRWWVQRRE